MARKDTAAARTRDCYPGFSPTPRPRRRGRYASLGSRSGQPQSSRYVSQAGSTLHPSRRRWPSPAGRFARSRLRLGSEPLFGDVGQLEGKVCPDRNQQKLAIHSLKNIISRDTASKARQTLTLVGGNFPEVFKVQQDALTKLVKYSALQLGPGAKFDIKSIRLDMERPVFIRVSYNKS